MFKRSNMAIFLFLGIKTSAFTACVLSNLLRNRTVKELYFLLIRCLFLLLFCCPLRVFRQSMCAAKADTCVRIPTHKALQTHQFRQCRARADKAAIAFPYGKDFLFPCSVKLTAKPYHERNILFVTPILAPAYPWTATFFRNRMLSLFRYLRQLTLYRHRNVTSVCVCFCFSAWFERRFFTCCFALPVVRISTNLKTLTWLLRCQSKFI